ncbi:hypothetical protein [Silvimonas soli]|uniref:hypothetical protein n=1 Tax=Silvimonas soli TaxID=2980100 RepID=UPI0024B38B38|nr:hypothetical protein [Silvimonas soli]
MTSDDRRIWTLPLQDCRDGSGDRILELPDTLLAELGWSEGDTLVIEPQATGFSLRKITNENV